MPRRIGEQRPVVDRQKSGFKKSQQKRRKLEEDQKISGSLGKYGFVSKPKQSINPTATSSAQADESSQVVSTGYDPIPNSDNFSEGACSCESDSVAESPECTEDEDEETPIKKKISGRSDALDLIQDSIQFENVMEAEEIPEKNNEDETAKAKIGGHQEENESSAKSYVPIDCSDPSLWRKPLSSSDRELLVTNGPVQKYLQNYPRTEGNPGIYRGFSSDHFSETTSFGDTQTRDWLLYSESSDSLYCFPCCLFSSKIESSPWSNYGYEKRGFSDYTHQGRAIQMHQMSQSHLTTVTLWAQYLKSAATNRSLGAVVREEFNREVSFWKSILRSIMDAVLYLAKNNLAFRGSSDKIGAANCGNFLSLLELLSHYYSPLARHIERLGKGKVSYMSPQIQNEFISLSARSVRKSILGDIKERKFFTILLDATPDSSHKEQISQIIRTVKISKSGCSVEENFIDFIHLDQKKGEDISKMIISKLSSDGLNINYCRGQGFDNGANMSGVYNGVQAHIRRVNELAEFLPCLAHSLNLVGQNAATKVLPAKLVLGQIQSLYVFFSSSTERWNALKPHVHKTLKSQSLTRWSSKADAVRAIFEEFTGVLEALEELITSEKVNAETLAASSAHLIQINNFRFVLGITIWNSILSRINTTNVVIQRKDIDISEAAKHIEGLSIWLKEFRENGFGRSLEKAREKASASNIDEGSGFTYRKSRNRVPVRFRENDEGDVENQDSYIVRFEREFFEPLMQKLIEEFNGRFISLKQTSEDFNFLWGEALANRSNKDLEKAALDLGLKYKQDLDAKLLVDEVVKLKSFVEPLLDEPKTVETTRAIDILDIITKYNIGNVFTNCHTAIRIFLTMPVTVAGNERSFSKLKIIKNYLRSTMGQERLSDLAILSIEHDRTSSLSFDNLIHDFATAKCRKVTI